MNFRPNHEYQFRYKKKPKRKNKKVIPKCFNFEPYHCILVLGDGDFSFSAGLAARRGSAWGIVATTLDSRNDLFEKYEYIERNLERLKKLDADIRFKFDATKMDKRLKPTDMFDRIIFNFPDTGTGSIELNQTLLKDFFISARKHLKSSGQIHLTTKTCPPESRWNLKKQATDAGLIIKESHPFHPKRFQGYRYVSNLPKQMKRGERSKDEFLILKFCKTYIIIKDPKKDDNDTSSTSVGKSKVDTHIDKNDLLKPALSEQLSKINRIGFWGGVLSRNCSSKIIKIPDHLILHLRHIVLHPSIKLHDSQLSSVSVWIRSLASKKKLKTYVTTVSTIHPNSTIKMDIQNSIELSVDGDMDIHITGYVTAKNNY